MSEFLKAIPPLTALWLGILTSISPCPLATNIAAVSFIAHQLTSSRAVLLSGLLYALGRTATYTGLGAVICSSAASAPFVSHFLQHKLPQVLGPILILVGAFLIDIFKLPLPSTNLGGAAERLTKGRGLLVFPPRRLICPRILPCLGSTFLRRTHPSVPSFWIALFTPSNIRGWDSTASYRSSLWLSIRFAVPFQFA